MPDHIGRIQKINNELTAGYQHAIDFPQHLHLLLILFKIPKRSKQIHHSGKTAFKRQPAHIRTYPGHSFGSSLRPRFAQQRLGQIHACNLIARFSERQGMTAHATA
ncbi:hypothetical protein D3C75_885630 [compost metagenome]